MSHESPHNSATERAWLLADARFDTEAIEIGSRLIHIAYYCKAMADSSLALREGFELLLRGWGIVESVPDAELVDWDQIAVRMLLRSDPSFVESWSTQESLDSALAAGELDLLRLKPNTDH